MVYRDYKKKLDDTRQKGTPLLQNVPRYDMQHKTFAHVRICFAERAFCGIAMQDFHHYNESRVL